MSDWRELLRCGGIVAGVDEAGRGPLAGDVYAAAVILPLAHRLPGLDDSKRLGAARREALAGLIREQALAWAVARATVEEIDRLNILQASLLAMRRAVDALAQVPQHVLVDGNRCPQWPYRSQAVVGGDALVPAISAASVLAKVERDASMRELERAFPGYGFAGHKGYPTPAHLAALARLGACSAHRRSFAPVRAVIAQCTLEL
jgi:ribonuclease HII